MSNEYGSDYISIVDEETNEEFNLEVLGDMDYNGSSYLAALPADMDENDPDYGMIILRIVPGEDGFEYYESIDDENEEKDVYEHFMALLFEDDEEENK